VSLLKYLLASLLVLSFAGTASAQEFAQPRLFKRYETGASYHRVTENVVTLTGEVPKAERAKIAIRVCSKQHLLVALAIAKVDPFRMAELLVGAYSYLPQEVIFIRSEDCPGKDPSIVELWALAKNSEFPDHLEARLSSRVTRTTLGKKHVNRGVRDYRSATQELIKNLQANPRARGVVIGYYFHRPSAALKRSLRVVKTLFQQSGLPPDRYLIHSMHWYDEFSESEGENPYPRVFLVEDVVY
jgi:hypothetical protein